MPRRGKVILVLGLALTLAAAGVATASNMGFKFVKNYVNQDPQVNSVCFPYFQSQFAQVNNVFDNITGCTQVCALDANLSPTCWLGNFTGSTPFAISNEDGYLVGVATGGTTQILVGSHNPALALSLANVDPQVNFKSMPYHMTYTQVNQVFDDIPGCTQVCTLDGNLSPTCWLGNFTGSTPFTTVIGEPLIIGVNPATTWTPDHY